MSLTAVSSISKHHLRAEVRVVVLFQWKSSGLYFFRPRVKINSLLPLYVQSESRVRLASHSRDVI